ncbi:MAG: hypothetical protein KAJ19_15305 [Gammaproteobacteria bacterium]|nr:hypothetical protein [Gammaproteobacteria bacterium]
MVFDAQPPAGVFFRDHVETLAHWLQRLLAEMTSTERAATSCMVVGPIAANYLERLPTFEVFEASLEPVAFPFMFIGTWRRFDPIRARWRFYDVWCDVQGFRGHINYQTGEVDVTSTHHEGYFATFPHGGLRTGFFQIANA